MTPQRLDVGAGANLKLVPVRYSLNSGATRRVWLKPDRLKIKYLKVSTYAFEF